MTAVDDALRHIQEVAPPETEYFDPYRPPYEALLGELRALGGESAMRELVAWVTDRTREDGQLPEPSSVRTQARVVCAERDLAVPEESPLAEGSAPVRDVVVREESSETGQRTPDGTDSAVGSEESAADRSGSGEESTGSGDPVQGKERSREERTERSESTESSGETEQGYTKDGHVAAVVYERMEAFEPYTAAELAGPLGLESERVEELLEQLSGAGRARQKSNRAGEQVWVRTPPTQSCRGCGGEFGVEFHDSVFGRVGFCPRCGAEL